MVKLVSGKLGAGKTLYCVSEIFDLLCKGRTVATNIHLRWDAMCRHALAMRGVRLQESQWVRVDPNKDRDWHVAIPWGEVGAPVACYLDEIHLFFNSNDWKSHDSNHKQLVSFLSQSRKACVDVTFIAQDSGTITKQFRVQAEYEYYIVNSSHIPLGPLGKFPFSAFIVCVRDAEAQFLIKRMWRSYDKRLFAVYGSHDFLDDHMQELAESRPRVGPLKLERINPIKQFWTRLAVEGRALTRKKI